MKINVNQFLVYKSLIVYTNHINEKTRLWDKLCSVKSSNKLDKPVNI